MNGRFIDAIPKAVALGVAIDQAALAEDLLFQGAPQRAYWAAPDPSEINLRSITPPVLQIAADEQQLAKANSPSRAETKENAELEQIFEGLAKNWRESTGNYSLTMRRYAHPTYHAILKLGEDAVPLILRELQHRPDRWFEALKVLSNENPAKDAKTFEDAIAAWLTWGKQRGHIS